MVAAAGRAWTPLQLSGASVVWGLLVVSAGFWFPAYRTVTERSCPPGRAGECGVVRGSWSTEVAVEGTRVLYVLAVPAVASVLVIGVVLAASRLGALSRWLGWCVVAALWALTVVASATVGWYFVPSAVLLAVAVSRMHTAGSAGAHPEPAPPRMP